MQINPKIISEFKVVFLNEYGIKIDDQIARSQCEQLFTLMSEIYKSIPMEDKAEYEAILSSSKCIKNVQILENK